MFKTGDIIDGRYEIKEQIGAGGGGTVYKAGALFAYRIFQSENQCVLKESDGTGISGKGVFF